MSEVGILLLLYGVGMLMLVAEIFIPSQGILCIVSLGLLVTAVVQTFSYGGQTAGVLAMVGCAVVLPTFAYLSVKYWPNTPIGRRMAPPNPVLTSADRAVEELRALVGQTGRSVSSLRPVGRCEFNGRRVSCVAEWGVIDASETVVATGIKNGNLAVRVQTV